MNERVITEEMISEFVERTDGEHGYEDLLAMFRAQEWHTENRWLFRDDIYGIEIEVSLSRMITGVIKEYKQHLELKNDYTIN